MNTRFKHLAAIDWSGAAGERHKGIAVAICAADGGPPRLVHPSRRWSRDEVFHWLTWEMPAETLVGLDLGMALPFVDKGAYFPDWGESQQDAKSLWAMVDFNCSDPHFGANSFVDHPEASRYFRRHGGREGDLFGGGAGRLRVTEQHQRRLGCKPYSNFNLVGAAQVGKSSLTGMRLLHWLDGGQLPVWPFDPVPDEGSVAVEIYTTIAAMAAGRPASRSKIRSRAELNQALAVLGSPAFRGRGPIDDHRSDALITAAWLRIAAHRPELWRPAAMTAEIARTEGWTFGVP